MPEPAARAAPLNRQPTTSSLRPHLAPPPTPAPVAAGVRVALLLDNLSSGGVQRVVLTLAENWRARGVAVDLLLCRDGGAMADQVPCGVDVKLLGRSDGFEAGRVALRAAGWRAGPVLRMLRHGHTPSVLRALPGLCDYLRAERPVGLLSAKPMTSLLALRARHLATVPTRVVAVEQTHLGERVRGAAAPYWREVPALARAFYPEADVLVAASQGVADDLKQRLGPRGSRVEVLPNPVLPPDAGDLPVPHPWLAGPLPVVLGIGSLNPQKDFATLLRAFARLRACRPARLVILGEGPLRGDLERQIRQLDIAGDCLLPGFVREPARWLRHANLFCLSSRYEGFGMVVAEALACGCPVVSTDCPSGPGEILAHGRYGQLVPINDPERLAQAMQAALEQPRDRERLRHRAAAYAPARIADRYLELLLGT